MILILCGGSELSAYFPARLPWANIPLLEPGPPESCSTTMGVMHCPSVRGFIACI